MEKKSKESIFFTRMWKFKKQKLVVSSQVHQFVIHINLKTIKKDNKTTWVFCNSGSRSITMKRMFSSISVLLNPYGIANMISLKTAR